MLASVLTLLPEIAVRRWRWLPEPVLLLPDGRRWLILLDPEQDSGDRNLHTMHQVKHVLDAPDLVPGSCGDNPVQARNCYRFAIGALVPTTRLRHDVASGYREAEALARSYGVPTSAMRQRLAELGLGGHVKGKERS